MWRMPNEVSVITSWTNGRKAVVDLVQDQQGSRFIRKVYRRGWRARMFREWFMAAFVSSFSSVGPRVLAFRPWRNELFLEFIPGERVLEWVLSRFGEGLVLAEFQSFHGLRPPNDVDPRVADAFRRFQLSTSVEVVQLKAAIKASYGALHRIGVKHGSPDPRNVIYDGKCVFIIDFDNARPSVRPSLSDKGDLEYWYGC